jgi:hypothetical protein
LRAAFHVRSAGEPVDARQPVDAIHPAQPVARLRLSRARGEASQESNKDGAEQVFLPGRLRPILSTTKLKGQIIPETGCKRLFRRG